MADPRLRVLVLHPRLEPVGGAEVVAAWALEALVREHEVDVLTWGVPDFRALDRDYGTSLAGAAIGIRRPPRGVRLAVESLQRLDRDPWSVQRFAVLMRMARRLRRRYDVVLCTHGEADLGGPGIQYVHQPWCGAAFRTISSPGPGPVARAVATLAFALRPWRLLSGFSCDRMRSNFTLANSEGTSDLVRSTYGIESTVLHPPVPAPAAGRPWGERENGFVCVGRLVAAKRVDHVLEILRRVRALGEDVALHVVGHVQDEEPAYGAALLDRLRAAGPWVSVHAGLSRAALGELLGSQRWGIHAMVREPFGIAVVESIRAGCVVFVQDDAGPAAIIGDAPALLFRDDDEAVDRIVSMLRSPAAQASARAHLAERGELFTAERFVEELRRTVDAFAASGEGRPQVSPGQSRFRAPDR